MGLVSEHPDIKEIRNHLLNYTLPVNDIVNQYSTEENPLSADAINWYRRSNLKPLIEKKQAEIEEEVGEAIRKLIYDKKDVLESLLAYAVDAMQNGTLRIRTVNELVKVTDQLFKLAGEGEYNTVKLKTGWGTELDKNPRTKGKVYSAEDFAEEIPAERDYR